MRQNLGSQREEASDPHLKGTDGERESKCMEWEAGMTRPSWKISTGKSIWEWVRLTLTPHVQPVMSWEKSSWQRITILETHIHRGSEAHLKTHTHKFTNQHTQCMQTNLVKCTCKGRGVGCHMHTQSNGVLRLLDVHANLDINRLPWSSQIRQIHCVIWLHGAERSHGAVRETCTQGARTEGAENL